MWILAELPYRAKINRLQLAISGISSNHSSTAVESTRQCIRQLATYKLAKHTFGNSLTGTRTLTASFSGLSLCNSIYLSLSWPACTRAISATNHHRNISTAVPETHSSYSSSARPYFPPSPHFADASQLLHQTFPAQRTVHS